ncbi:MULTISPECIES: YggS family pyridoxal phosphate-dependent enzyme [Streptococcus]|jgi:pyridoxal phosphate enzyme (YggS family)|uniref:Pyridoxal phosphate homeostasis protein n=1 Tax=Streptococcus parasanguinis TaxID=1318 RepID=A0A943XX71_STRPA|nr:MULTISPECIES: YggS family pyridoxal phosphate-dependent enzyme [Streptococcus]MBS5356550.1 YggS family pyridoxal phosphate-dependent enzyme [Streptococcus parasanguinis]MBS6536326.1 YggS family pyridoxal phosphate-dependent enzyme [Streptococcus parasanguinis]MCP8963067.1 YggS family pyridoxal phosphate-dependent enzyme [Streptococcus sp. CF8_St5-12]MCP8981008.1 YggS family pyridoxal phosphate-dependent enzyme [Streptococcus sp. CF8_St5-16]MCP8982857.1 YggS family pyridoxal phosphate-depend
MNLGENADLVRQQVETARNKANRRDQVNVIAVTKYVDVATTEALVKTGIQHIGENRVDKFLEKYQALKEYDLTWHLIGSLQRRKVKDVINLVDYFHALDSVKLAQEIQKRAEHPIKCFLQVNISGEESKHGFAPDELDDVLAEIAQLDKIEIVGLMTMAPFEASQEELQDIFSKTHQLQKQLEKKQLKNMPFSELSMGMSRDFEVAIANGATYVRIGTSFFK